jgi:hypothetical protein
VSENTGILGVTTYLLGMATGAVVLAPLSEMYVQTEGDLYYAGLTHRFTGMGDVRST